MTRREITARLYIQRAAIASVIEASRDHGLSAKEYRDLIKEFEAILELLRKHQEKNR